MEKVKEMNQKNQKERGENKKLSYEELKNYATQLVDMNNRMKKVIEELSNENFLKRIDILFKVLDNKELFGNEFTTMCVEELKEIITINREEEVKEKEDK